MCVCACVKPNTFALILQESSGRMQVSTLIGKPDVHGPLDVFLSVFNYSDLDRQDASISANGDVLPHLSSASCHLLLHKTRARLGPLCLREDQPKHWWTQKFK